MVHALKKLIELRFEMFSSDLFHSCEEQHVFHVLLGRALEKCVPSHLKKNKKSSEIP